MSNSVTAMTPWPPDDDRVVRHAERILAISKDVAAAALEAIAAGGDGLAVVRSRGGLDERQIDLLRLMVAAPRSPGRIRGYLLEEVIGQGGMGVVYRAIHERDGREVALKVIATANAGDPAFRERFRREAALATTLAHPNVVRCIEAGEEEGRLFLAMELLQGGDASALVARHGGRLPAELALAICADAAAGLQAIHAAGQVHRDIKPANLLLAADGRTKVTDLGLVRPLGDGGHLTAAGAVPGTPAFMAPEQARGDDAIDARADIYALGATLFYLVTGRTPFPALSGYAAARSLVEPIPDPREALPACSAAIAAIVRRAGAVDPAGRYPDAAAMRADLLDVLAGRTPRHASPAPTIPARRLREGDGQDGRQGTPPVDAAAETAAARALALLRKARSAAFALSSAAAPGAAGASASALPTLAADLDEVADAAQAAGRRPAARVARAAQALALQLHGWPDHIGPDTLRTLRQGLDGIELLLGMGPASERGAARALILDDETLSRRSMAAALSTVGIQSTGVDSAERALDLCERQRFDLVLSDLVMEGINGFAFARRVRAIPGYERRPLIFVTGMRDFDRSFRPSPQGADDLIIKPFLHAELALKSLIFVHDAAPAPWTRVERPDVDG